MAPAATRMTISMTLPQAERPAKLSLARFLDRMVEAARQAAVPSSLWLAGIIYQGFSLGWTFGITIALPMLEEAMPDGSPFSKLELWGRTVSFTPLIRTDSIMDLRGGGWIALLLIPIFFRLVSGLAMIAPASRWETARGTGRAPSLRQAWRGGSGFARSACGLWIQIVLMMFAAALLFIGPTRLLFDYLKLDGNGAPAVLATGVCIALVIFYGFVLTVLFQIALHSLVQNRRGVGSALLHAWRIAKNDPMATVRATMVDAFLFAGVAVGLGLYLFLLGLVAPIIPPPVRGLLILPAILVEAWT
ncbi:MAG: hypothetical protein ACI841_005229, partial [Planctomycetota bacterium]